jgi:hypothetical protein
MGGQGSPQGYLLRCEASLLLLALTRVFRRFVQARPAKALYHPFFAVGVAGGELASNLYQEFAHLEATDYARGIAEIAGAAKRSG